MDEIRNNTQTERIPWVDAAKGIGILLVVLGHCIGNLQEPVNRVILTFHMPLFFFLSGFCQKLPAEKFSVYLKKKAVGLLIPQITLGTIGLLFAAATVPAKGGGYLTAIGRGFYR